MAENSEKSAKNPLDLSMGRFSVEMALKAVESDGDALQYVLHLELFLKIAATLGIEVES